MKKFLNLGIQPLANSYLKKKNLNKKEAKFNLSAGFDEKTYLVSILKTVSKEKMFNKEYPYKSSESRTMRSAFKKFAIKIKKNYKPKFILEIGSNDGAFLFNFNKRNAIGVEPCSNLAKKTQEKKYKTFSEYWDTKLSKKILKFGKADVVYSANTLSHIKNLDNVFKALNIILADDGVLIIEDPSLLKCLMNNSYDQFYCEHIYVFSTIAIDRILSKYDLEIFKVENVSTHGGSNRYYIKKKNSKKFKIDRSVNKEIQKEINYGLKKFLTYRKFARRVENSKKKLFDIFKKIKKENKNIIGYGATAKSCTVLNYCKINNKFIDFFYDTTSYKINKYLPGTKILIKKYKKLDINKIDYVYLGAWNFRKEIFEKEKQFINKGGKFITHVPFPRII
jgi:SAM-dependent methyltransferase